jgi:hypothetical protein
MLLAEYECSAAATFDGNASSFKAAPNKIVVLPSQFRRRPLRGALSTQSLPSSRHLREAASSGSSTSSSAKYVANDLNVNKQTKKST